MLGGGEGLGRGGVGVSITAQHNLLPTQPGMCANGWRAAGYSTRLPRYTLTTPGRPRERETSGLQHLDKSCTVPFFIFVIFSCHGHILSGKTTQINLKNE